MFDIFYAWGFQSRGPIESDPIEFDAGPDELSELAFYSSMAADLARTASPVDDWVEWDAARLLGHNAPPPQRKR